MKFKARTIQQGHQGAGAHRGLDRPEDRRDGEADPRRGLHAGRPERRDRHPARHRPPDGRARADDPPGHQRPEEGEEPDTDRLLQAAHRQVQEGAPRARAEVRRLARGRQEDAPHGARGRGGGRPGQARADRREPAPRRLDRQEVHEPRSSVPRPHPGGQHRPHEGGREVRAPARLQVLDVRDVVDPPGDHARDRRPGADDPHPRPHDRDDQQADAHLAVARSGARPRAERRRDREAHGHAGLARSARS